MRRVSRILAVLSMFLTAASVAATDIELPPGTEVSGTLTTQTWSTNGSPYQVTGDITVPTGVTLTIDPGVIVEFNADVQFSLQGTLDANGTETDSVFFVEGTSTWRGFSITNGSHTFDYVAIRGVSSTTNNTSTVYMEGNNASATLQNCVIEGNTAYRSGGLYVGNTCSATLSECIVRNNTVSNAATWGSAVLVSNSSSGTTPVVFLENSVFDGNTGALSGGFLGSLAGSVEITNCTAINNSATNNSVISATGSSTVITATNCIFWGNSGSGTVGLSNDATADITYSDIQGGYTGTGNINSDPLLNDAYTPASNSPCVDTGDPTSPADFDGSPADMGAYAAGTNGFVSGTISTTTWTIANGPYTITGDITIPSGNTLTIDPGVKVRVESGAGIIVVGELVASGTETDSVIIEALSTSWKGITSQGVVNLAYTRVSNGSNTIGGALSTSSGSSTSITLTNCVLSNNTATNTGGAIFCNSGTLTLDNTSFIGNSSLYGGAIYASNVSSAIPITDCLFKGNAATTTSSSSGGAALYLYGSSATVTSTRFIGNTSNGNGGAMCVKSTSNYSVETTVDRCTFSGNTALSGAIVSVAQDTSSCSLTMKNSIVWGNASSTSPVESSGWPGVEITYSDIEGGYTGTGNIDADPLFTDAFNGDYTLQSTSPCIDAGDPADPDADETAADMGAFVAGTDQWVSGTISTTTWTTANSPYTVMGSLTIPSGNTLTIEPGVTVRVVTGATISVSGTLVANGTEADSVIIKATSTTWGGILSQGVINLAYTRVSNSSATNGGAFNAANSNSDITLTNCVVSNNTASANGGAIFFNSGSLTLENTSFIGNSGSNGGAIYASLTNTTIPMTGCLFKQNTATTSNSVYGGGAISLFSTSATITSCSFIENASYGNGGAIQIRTTTYYPAAATIDRCTFWGNNTSNGGTIYLLHGSLPCSMTMTNSILWGNTYPTSQIELSGSPTVDITYSDIEGSYTGTGNIETDPLFTDAENGDFALRVTSPCINAGDPASDTDPDGTTADMGAFPVNTNTWISGVISSTTWTAANSPYVISGTAQINSADSLVIGPGVTVQVFEDVNITVVGKLITQGTETDSVIVEGANGAGWNGFNFYGGDDSRLTYTRISGIDYGSSPGSIRLSVGSQGATRVKFDHCVVQDNVAQYGGGFLVNTGVTLEMNDCAILRNSTTTGSYSGSAFRVTAGALELTRCVVAKNYNYTRGAVDLLSGGTATLTNCTFADNVGTMARSAVNVSTGCTATLKNSIIWGNIGGSPQAGALSGGTYTITYSDIEDYTSEVDCFASDPLFTDAANGDYSLTLESPCINTGDPADSPDPNGTRADIGGILFEGITGQILTATIDAGTYHVAARCTVDAGNTLTINPGVNILFDVNTPLAVYGSITAVGTETDSIIFEAGDADTWGGVRLYSEAASTFRYVRFSDGASYPDGSDFQNSGGVLCSEMAPVSLSHCLFRDNEAPSNGGAATLLMSTGSTIDTCTFLRNTATYTGGAVYADNVFDLVIRGCEFTENTGNYAGALALWYSTAQVDSCVFTGNSAGIYAGAVKVFNGEASITGCVMSGNTVLDADEGYGGAISSEGAIVSISGCRITGNSAAYSGGIDISSGDATIRYCLVYNNASNNDAGGIGIYNPSSAYVQNCTVIGNQGYGIQANFSDAICEITNSIVRNNDGGTTQPAYRSARGADTAGRTARASVDIGSTMSTPTVTYSNVSDGYTGVGNIDMAPVFADTANGDFSYVLGSPGINHGNPDSTDTDGTVRDLGAYPYDIPAGMLVVNGEITTTTWSQGTEVHVNGPLTVNESSTLTIESGVTVNFDVDTTMIVSYGAGLTVSGIEGDTVRFQPGLAPQWHGLRGSYPGDILIEYASFTGGNARSDGGDYDVYGGVVFFENESSSVYATIRHCSFTGNYTEDAGGAVAILGMSGYIENCTFFDNDAAGGGGAVYFAYGGGSITDCTFLQNKTTTNGAAVMSEDCPLVIEGSLFDGNNATGSGGAVYGGDYGELTLVDCVFDGNIAANYGGAVCAEVSGTVDMTRCAAYDNTAGSSGGGFCFNSVTATLNNCTVAYNALHGISLGAATLNVANSILWNTGATEIYEASTSTITVSYSDVQGYYLNGNDMGPYPGTGNINTSPIFIDSTGRDLTLILGSPCINRAHPDSADTDGTRRDMGAYPYNLPTNVKVVNGTLPEKTVWATGDTIHVNAALTVAYMDTLTIQPGVDVFFDADVPLTVNGRLDAVGTEADSIRFDTGLAGQWKGLRLVGPDSSVLAYARISSGYAAGGGYTSCGGALAVYGTDVKLGASNCVITGNVASDAGGGVFVANAALCTMTDCIISDNIAGDNGGGMAFGSYARGELTRTIIAGNTSTNIVGGLHSVNQASVTLDHVTIWGNNAAGTAGGMAVEETGYTAGSVDGSNCIIWGNSSPQTYAVVPDSIELTYSNVEGGYTGTGNIDSDPLFMNAAAGDFSLSCNLDGSGKSPCIDTGDPAYALDIDGSATDMGTVPFVMFGDVTLNRQLSTADATMILEHVVGLRDDVSAYCGDVTDNSVVSSFDAALILYKVLNTSYVFPVEGGAALRQARGGETHVTWVQNDAGWALVADDETNATGTYLKVQLPDGQAATAAGGELIASHQTGDEIQIAMVRRSGGSNILLQLSGMWDTAPHILEMTMDEMPVQAVESIRQLQFSLSQNAPNPFNPTTSIHFSLPSEGLARLSIYNSLGQIVRVLMNENLAAGQHMVSWDGTDDLGRSVGSGVYLYRLTAQQGVLVRRMMLVK